MDADLRKKALTALRQGRVMVTHASNPLTLGGQSESVTATVQSSRPRTTRWYIVDRWATTGRWECTCSPVAQVPPVECAHVAAVQIVTGWAS